MSNTAFALEESLPRMHFTLHVLTGYRGGSTTGHICEPHRYCTNAGVGVNCCNTNIRHWWTFALLNCTLWVPWVSFWSKVFRTGHSAKRFRTVLQRPFEITNTGPTVFNHILTPQSKKMVTAIKNTNNNCAFNGATHRLSSLAQPSCQIPFQTQER